MQARMNDLQWKAEFGRREVRLERIQFALGDIAETLQIWRDEKSIHDPYMVKLWREWDALIVEEQKIMKCKGQRNG